MAAAVEGAMDEGRGHCAEEVRRHDHDRWLAALFAPEGPRAGLMALYAFNLELARIPAAVREPMLGEIRLQWWRETIDAALAGSARAQPVALALAAAHRAQPFTPALLRRLIDARTGDLYPAPPADLAQLETYAGETAGTLGELAAEALGAGGAASREAAREVGIGWALGGLIRALPFHVAEGRVYVPADLLAQAGLAAENLWAPANRPRLKPCLARIGDAAAAHFARARALRREVERAAMPALLPAAVGELYLARLR